MRLIRLAVVITLNLLLAPLAVDAQPSEKVYRIGMLERTTSSSSTDPPTDWTSGFRSWLPTWFGSRWT